MNQTYLNKLEYNQILQKLTTYCHTYIGKNFAINLLPSNQKETVATTFFVKRDGPSGKRNDLFAKRNGPNEKRNDLFAKGNGPNEKRNGPFTKSTLQQ